MADDPDQDGGAPLEGAAPDGTPHLRHQPHFRGHIVADDDEPPLVFDTPADPPPAPPAAPDGHASPG
jgi:hypothetical protein